MKPSTNSAYTLYDMTEEQALAGSVLSFEQRAVIQNRRMETIAQKLSLRPESLTQDGKESYWQQEAYLRGQLDILTYILEMSDAAQSALLPQEDLSDSSNNPI